MSTRAQAVDGQADVRDAVAVVTVAVCILAPLLVLADAPSVLRFPAVLASLCLAPGGAVLPLLNQRAARLEIGLVVGFSLAASTLVAQSMLWAGAWSPDGFLYGLSAACLLSTAASRVRRRRAVDGPGVARGRPPIDEPTPP